MTGRKAAAIAVVIIAAVGLSAYLLLIYSSGIPPPGPPNGNGTGTTPKTTLSVLSSPATFPFIERWAAQYNNGRNLGTVQPFYSADADDANIPVLYSNVSSFLADHSADLAVSGRAVQPTGNFTYAGSVFLPVSPQAIAVVYNVPGFPDLQSGLKLDGPTLCAVLSGNATRWNDPRIQELNPDISLPDQPIVVVHERKSGSATGLLEQYLNSTVAWPESSQAAESPDTLSSTVRQTPFSIGYVDFSNAVQTRMTYAALQNSDGEYVMPSSDSIGRAIQNGTVVHEPEDEEMTMPPTVSVGQLGNGSYPVVGLYYVALSDAPGAQSPEKAAASLDFARWISSASGQQMLADVQYPSVYDWNDELAPLASALAAGMQTPRFENATNLTNNSNDSVYGQVAASGDSVFVVWEESVQGQNYDIFVKRSQNGGSTFGSAANLSRNAGFSEHPQIAAAGSSVYVVWADNTSGNKEVLFARSTSGGNAFGTAAPLSSSGVNAYNQEIAASGSNNVYVVWQEQREGGNAVIFRTSSDNGKTFGEPVVIAENVDSEAFPKVAADESAVHVVWANPGQPGLRHVSSSDGGTTFSEVKQLNGSRPVGEAQVAVHGDNVYVVWGGLNAHSTDQLFYVTSSNGGATFSEPAGVDNSALVNPMNVELAIMLGENEGEHFVHIVAQVEVSAENEELLLVSTADGRTFTEPVNISNNAGISECPSIAVSGHSIFVAWEDRTAGNNEILYAKGVVP